ncbi:Hypothetical predicted protein, partial [Pelobates cultripes]
TAPYHSRGDCDIGKVSPHQDHTVSPKKTTYDPLNIPERRTQLLRDLYIRRISIAFLQETHFSMLKSKHYPNAACSNHPTARSAGVAIFLGAKLQFHEADRLSDANGRRNLDLRRRFQRTTTPSYRLVHGIQLHNSRCSRDLRLVDCWRAMHPDDREYTHYSMIHKRYSRIVYILIEQELLTTIRTAEIGAAQWSDHGPVILKIDSPRMRPTSWAWRLQDSLLLDLTVREQVSEELTSYFTLNTPEDHIAITIWEAHKSVIRKTLMHLASKKRKEYR